MPRGVVDLEGLKSPQALALRAIAPPQGLPFAIGKLGHAVIRVRDLERSVRFYVEVLGFPLVEMFENRDYQGSTHFFFDIGHGNTLAYFDLPGLDLPEYREVLGGHHHLAISMEPDQWRMARERLDAAGIEYAHVSGSSLYFNGPDGERLELISDPLGEMYGKPVG